MYPPRHVYVFTRQYVYIFFYPPLHYTIHTLLFHLTIHLRDGSKSAYKWFLHFLTTAEYSTVWLLHNSLNQFPTDRHLGCSQSFAITNCAMACNLAPTSSLRCVSVFAGSSPGSRSVGSESTHWGIFTDIAKLPSAEVILICAPNKQCARVRVGL